MLLIAAALDDAELRDLSASGPARSGSTPSSRSTTRPSSSGRSAIGADLVGVNQRDLVTFQVDTARAVRMAPQMPAGVVRVAESGVSGPADARVLAAAGYHAVLVGELLVTSGDPEAGVAALRSPA